MSLTEISIDSRIREMDACELKEHIGHLAEVSDHSGEILRQARLCMTQYQQLTGQPLDTATPGLSIAQASVVAAAQRMALQQTVCAP